MKLSEIKKAIDNGEKIKYLNIKVHTYLPLTKKMMMVLGYDTEEGHQNGIIDDCIDYNGSYALINHFIKDLTIKLSIINFYTDIEIDEIEDMTQYDVIISYKLWDWIKEEIGCDEYKNLLSFIELSISEKLKAINSFEAIICNGLSAIIDKLPTNIEVKQLARTVVRDLNSMDTSKFPMLTELRKVLDKKYK